MTASEWLPEASAPIGKWLLVRLFGTDGIRQAVKIGGLWWIADLHYRELTRLSLHSYTIPATDPNWKDRFSIWAQIIPEGGPNPIYVASPDEWCDIPEAVIERLVNRLPLPS
jgi:hypothetical protein